MPHDFPTTFRKIFPKCCHTQCSPMHSIMQSHAVYSNIDKTKSTRSQLVSSARSLSATLETLVDIGTKTESSVRKHMKMLGAEVPLWEVGPLSIDCSSETLLDTTTKCRKLAAECRISRLRKSPLCHIRGMSDIRGSYDLARSKSRLCPNSMVLGFYLAYI